MKEAAKLTQVSAEEASAEMPSASETVANATKAVTQNATLVPEAFAEEQAISIVSGASNPSNAEFYSPGDVTVSAGSEVKWTNNDATIHTVTQGSAEAPVEGGFDSSIINAGGEWEHTFDTAGTYDYYCSLHPFMKGKVTVT